MPDDDDDGGSEKNNINNIQLKCCKINLDNKRPSAIAPVGPQVAHFVAAPTGVRKMQVCDFHDRKQTKNRHGVVQVERMYHDIDTEPPSSLRVPASDCVVPVHRRQSSLPPPPPRIQICCSTRGSPSPSSDLSTLTNSFHSLGPIGHNFQQTRSQYNTANSHHHHQTHSTISNRFNGNNLSHIIINNNELVLPGPCRHSSSSIDHKTLNLTKFEHLNQHQQRLLGQFSPNNRSCEDYANFVINSARRSHSFQQAITADEQQQQRAILLGQQHAGRRLSANYSTNKYRQFAANQRQQPIVQLLNRTHAAKNPFQRHLTRPAPKPPELPRVVQPGRLVSLQDDNLINCQGQEMQNNDNLRHQQQAASGACVSDSLDNIQMIVDEENSSYAAGAPTNEQFPPGQEAAAASYELANQSQLSNQLAPPTQFAWEQRQQTTSSRQQVDDEEPTAGTIRRVTNGNNLRYNNQKSNNNNNNGILKQTNAAPMPPDMYHQQASVTFGGVQSNPNSNSSAANINQQQQHLASQSNSSTQNVTTTTINSNLLKDVEHAVQFDDLTTLNSQHHQQSNGERDLVQRQQLNVAFNERRHQRVETPFVFGESIKTGRPKQRAMDVIREANQDSAGEQQQQQPQPRTTQVLNESQAELMDELMEDLQQQQQVNANELQRRLQTPRPSFAPPFPVPITSSAATSPATPLTNHEIYELIQKNQLQQQQQQQATGSSRQRSLKQPKRSSLYVSSRHQHHELERQNSVIVGTPRFRERYESNANLGKSYASYSSYKQQQQQQQSPPSPIPIGPNTTNQQANVLNHQQHNAINAFNQQQPQHQLSPAQQNQPASFNIMQQQKQAQHQQTARQEDSSSALAAAGPPSPQPPPHHLHPVHPHFTGYDINSTSGDPTNVCAIFLTALSLLLVLVTFPLSLFLCIKVVQEYERVVIFRLGRLLKGGARGPGIFFIIPCIDTYCKVDLRTVSFDVPPQEILSKDSVTVAVDAVVYYRISNATIAVSNVENYGRSTRLLAATTLRNVLGTKNLSEILSERETISHIMQSSLDEATEPWGVKVERVEIKDVRLPVQLQRAMAAEAEAAREARAKVIAAEGEQKASKALRSAAEVIAMSPQALQLRYLQTLNSIAAERNSTIVFPLPLEIFSCFSTAANRSMISQQQQQQQQYQPPQQVQQMQQQQQQQQQVALPVRNQPVQQQPQNVEDGPPPPQASSSQQQQSQLKEPATVL